MADRLTKWEGSLEDGTRKAALAKRDAPFPDLFLEALGKLARYEDAEERHLLRLPSASEAALLERIQALVKTHQLDQTEIIRLRQQIEAMQP